jgi:hypothetical protein
MLENRHAVNALDVSSSPFNPVATLMYHVDALRTCFSQLTKPLFRMLPSSI